MTPTAAPSSDAIELPPAGTAASATSPSVPQSASSASPSSSSSSSSLSFASLLSPSTASLGGTIGSSAHPTLISPMVPPSSSAASSGSSPNVASGSPALPFDVRSFVESVRQKQLHRRIRPAAAFFDPKRFSRPQSTTEATTRVELNLQWFYVNYLLIAALILVLTILSQPSFLLTLLVLAAVWLFALTRDVLAVPFTPYTLSGRPKMWTLYGATTVMLFLFAGSAILTVVAICGMVVLAHATLHATPTQDERDADEQLDSITMV